MVVMKEFGIKYVLIGDAHFIQTLIRHFKLFNLRKLITQDTAYFGKPDNY